MKKTLVILILSILVLSAVPILSIPKAKADASEARVLSDYTWYIASSQGVLSSTAGDLVVVGEVQNVGSGIIENVTLTATATDSNGTTLGTASTPNEGTVFTYQTLPAGKAPFIIDFPSSSSWSSKVASVQVTVVSVIDATSPPYEGLNMLETPTAFNNNGTYTVVGTIINNGSQTMGYVWVVTTFYNNAGKVIGLNFTDYLANPFGPIGHDGALHYVATPTDNTPTLSSEITTYTYVIDSIPYTGSTTQNTATPTPTGSSGSSSQYPWLLPVVVVVVIVAIAVAALMFLKKKPEAHPETEYPPPPPPPPPPEA